MIMRIGAFVMALHGVERLRGPSPRGAAVDQDDAILTDVDGDVPPAPKITQTFSPDLRSCRVPAAYQRSAAGHQRQRQHPWQRRFDAESRCIHGRRSINHLIFAWQAHGIFGAFFHCFAEVASAQKSAFAA